MLAFFKFPAASASWRGRSEHTIVEGYEAIISDSDEPPRLGRPEATQLRAVVVPVTPILRGGGRCIGSD